MITHCPHCRTEFMLEDADMPAGGLSLQCASCKQVFGVLASTVGAGSEKKGSDKTASKAGPPTAPAVVEIAFALDDDISLTPIVPWQLKRESGEVLTVDNLDTVKRWIADKRARREDLLSQDGVAWQRLANMRELIPSFNMAARPEGTQLVEREAFVVSVARGTDSVSTASPSDARAPRPQIMEVADTWPGEHAPLVTAEPARRASANYNHDKEHPFPIPISHVHRDYPALWRRQQWVRRAAAGMLGAGLAVSALVWVDPPWMHRVVGAFYHEAVPDAAVSLVRQGYVQLYPDTVASLQTAAQTFRRAIAVAGHYAEAHAGLAEAELTLAETYRQQVQDGLRGVDKKQKPRQTEQSAEQAKAASASLQAGLLAAQQAIRLAPESTAANRAMALYYEVAGTELSRAAPYLRQARANAPDDARVMYVDLNAGTISTQQAIDTYGSIVARMPQFNRARYKLARLYMQENDLEHAREQVDAILASAPAHNLARWLLGDAPDKHPTAGASTVVSNLPERDNATLYQGSAPTVPPLPPGASYEALVHQGQLLRATHQLPDAIALYERAIARDRRRPAGFIGLGWCQLDQDQSAAALLNFTRAIELSPWSLESHYGMAEVLRAQGDYQQAIKHYRQVLVIDPDGAMGRLARQVLDEISR